MAPSQHKPDFVLSDGREIYINLNAITAKEYDDVIVNKKSKQKETHDLIGRTVGMSGDEIYSLGYNDYRNITQLFFKRCREPLADPNSVSESTSES